MVDEALGGEFAIGDDDGAAVEGAHDGVEDTYFLDVALIGATLDVVVDLEGFHEEDDDAAGEVLEGALEGHTDGEAHGAEESDEGGGLDADDIHCHDDNHGLEEHVDEGAEEGLEGAFGAALVECFHDEFLEHFGQFHADPEDEDGDEELGDELDGEFGEGGEAVADDGVLAGDDIFDVGEAEIGEAVFDGGEGAIGSLDGFRNHDVGGVGLRGGGDESGGVVV